MNDRILKIIRDAETRKMLPDLSGIRYECAPERRRAPGARDLGDCVDETLSADETLSRRIARRLGIAPERES